MKKDIFTILLAFLTLVGYSQSKYNPLAKPIATPGLPTTPTATPTLIPTQSPTFIPSNSNGNNVNSLPHSISYASRTTTWNTVNLNNSGSNIITVNPGANVSVDVAMTYTHATYCPGCIVQFYIRLNDNFNSCLRTGQTYNGGSVNKSFNFTAPTEPGTYYLQSAGSLQYYCLDSTSASTEFGNGTVGTLIVSGNSNSPTFDLNRAGTGGSEYPDLKAEFSDIPHERGTLSMARSSDPNSANSQFFICFKSAPHLDRQYTVFGKVIKGMEYVDLIKKGEGSNGEVSKPDKIISLTAK